MSWDASRAAFFSSGKKPRNNRGLYGEGFFANMRGGMKKAKPRPLERGDKIGIVAPASPVNGERLEAGVELLRQRGFVVELAPGIRERKGYLAGDPRKRAQALADFFCRDDIAAVFCARGGFGSAQLLPFLDASKLRLHPKIFVGYSDVSVLLNWLLQGCGIVAYHGPMVAQDLARGLPERSEEFFWGTLLGEKREWRVELGEVLRPGRAEAEMVGGCLTAVVTTLGTPYDIDTSDRILFLEEVNEKPYRIERMLTHLKMAGKLEGLAGLVLGDFTDCEGEGPRGLKEIIAELFEDARYPVVAGFPAGHGNENLLLPFGVRMVLDADAGTLSLVESPVA